MSELEPKDVGPRVGGDRPVGPADRDLVVNLLNAAYTEGRLPGPETQRRLALAQAAQTFDDLIPLTRDLTASNPPGLVPRPAGGPIAPASSTGANLATVGGESTGQVETLVGVFGASIRKGAWHAPAAITAISAFGGNEIDLTEAIWSGPAIEVTVLALFGGVDIKLPRGTEVVNRTVAVFGGVDVKGQTGGQNGRRVVIKGLCLFGGVSVKSA
jgi:hypothetical protein